MSKKKPSSMAPLREMHASWSRKNRETMGWKAILDLIKRHRLAICTLAALLFVWFIWYTDTQPERQAGFLSVPAMEITLRDGEKTTVIETYARTMTELFKHQGITLGHDDVVQPGLRKPLEDAMEIIIQRNVRITVLADGKPREMVLPLGTTVRQALTQSGVELSSLDQYTPASDVLLENSMTVQVYRMEFAILEETTRIPFKTVKKDNDKLTKGTTRVTREGTTGKTVTRTSVLYRDGVVVHSELLETVVLREPVSEVVEIGTAKVQTVAQRGEREATPKPNATAKPSGQATAKPAATNKPDTSKTDELLQTINKNGTELQYSAVYQMTVTAYTHTGRKTATGLWPKRGIVAVDPAVIPYGTKLYVDGYGYCIAQDTGVSGDRIDVFMETYDECVRWGRKRGVNVYVVD